MKFQGDIEVFMLDKPRVPSHYSLCTWNVSMCLIYSKATLKENKILAREEVDPTQASVMDRKFSRISSLLLVLQYFSCVVYGRSIANLTDSLN